MTIKYNHTGVKAGYFLIGLLFFFILSLSLSVWAKPYSSSKDTVKAVATMLTDTMQVNVITGNAGNCLTQSGHIDTLSINMAFLQKMRENGELLSTDEFASRITNYYNTLVAVLTALFVLFTVVTYLTIKSQFEGKFEDKARELEDKQREKIVTELRSMLNDSKKIDEVIRTAIAGHVDDNIAHKDEVDGMSASIEQNTNNIITIITNVQDVKKKQNELFKVVEELQEQVASRATILSNKTDDNNPRDGVEALTLAEAPDSDSTEDVEKKVEEGNGN